MRKQGQQRGHRMQHGDVLCYQRQWQGFGVRGDFFRGNPQRGADQIADPDFLERHVKSHRKALVHPVPVIDTQQRVFAAQEMANTALADLNAFGLAGRTRGVDHVGRVRGQQPFAALQRQGGQQQLLCCPEG